MDIKKSLPITQKPKKHKSNLSNPHAYEKYIQSTSRMGGFCIIKMMILSKFLSMIKCELILNSLLSWNLTNF